MSDAVKVGFVRKAIVFVLSVAMVGAGLLMMEIELLHPATRQVGRQ